MCGIIGSSSKNNINLHDIRLGMLMADDRGGHSTGFTNDEIILRSTNDVRDFFGDEKGELQVPEDTTKFISHTRYATEGPKTLANAHPFNFNNALGCHNGTIENFKELNEEYGAEALDKLKKKHPGKSYVQSMDSIESDSLLTYYLISRFGLRKTVKMLKGSMALCYFDNKGRINAYRYDKPLCYGFKGDELWFGTLKKYLDAVGCHNIKPFTQHCHFIIEDGHVVDAKQLKDEELPFKKTSKSKDLDPDFSEKSQMKGITTVKHEKKKGDKREKKEEDKGDINDRKAETKTENIEFKAPAYAKCETSKDDGELILWWFGQDSHELLFLEKGGVEDIISYDLSSEKETALFNDDFPELKEAVQEEYELLELTYELKKSNKENVAH